MRGGVRPIGVRIKEEKGGINIWFWTNLVIIRRWISGSFCFSRNQEAGSSGVPVIIVGVERDLVASKRVGREASRAGARCQRGFKKKNEIKRGRGRGWSLIGSTLKVRV